MSKSVEFNPNAYIKPNVTKDDVIQLKKVFDSIDLDHSNSINPSEIRLFFQKLALQDSKDAIYDMLKEMDDDYSGGVDFEEFFSFLTAIYDEKDKRDEIRKLVKRAIELPSKEVSKKPEPAKKVDQKESKKDEKSKEAGFSREKQKKEVLRSKAKTSNKGNREASSNNEFDPEAYVSVSLPKDQVMDLKRAFDILDEDGSGTVSPNEMLKYFEKMGLMMKNKFIYQVLADLDKDNSGGIDFEEFVRFLTAKVSDKTPNLREEIERIFAFFDSNHSGKVSVVELKMVAQFLGEEMSEDELKEMFVKADIDDDGFVTFDDFYNIWTGQGYY